MQGADMESVESAGDWVTDLHVWLELRLFDGQLSNWMAKLIVISGTLVVAIVAYLVTRQVLLAAIRRMAARTRTHWDDRLVERGFFSRLALLVPAAVVYLASPFFTDPFFSTLALDVVLRRLATAWIVVVALRAISSLLNAAADIYDSLDRNRGNPISGLVGAVKLVLWVLGIILCLAAVTGKDPSVLVAGIGALTAVLMLVFKDSIMGLVASIQIFSNDLVRVGDWIEMPAFGIDGDVLAVTLTTLKVQNWDRTIATVPSYAVITDSVKNWRGMQDSGGRRIKRSIAIDMSSVKFCSPELIDRFSRFSMLEDYISGKQEEVTNYNRQHGVDMSEIINGRRITNLGTFRAYLVEYLRRHPEINNEMTLLVRQLPPSSSGIPIEIYVFSRDKEWSSYESLQADIFDHVLAVVGEFELRVFQNPTGADWLDRRGRSSAA
jgi:miniconductance mechanosensitive channel